jgi:hypothetical protein
MWRGYGKNVGVALVFKGDVFLTSSDALKAYSSPVAYLDDKGFDVEYQKLLNSIEQNIGVVKSVGKITATGYLFNAYRYAVLCTKHPGFAEEREWRVIYQPTFQPSARIRIGVESINGTTQTIAKIPLRDVREENLVGLELPGSVDRIIIGPSEFPTGLPDAFRKLLMDTGASPQDAASKIIVSDIPLRH